MTNYLDQRRQMKLGLKKTSAEEKRDAKPKLMAKKSAKTIQREKEAKKSKELTLSQFMNMMADCAPENCQETGQILTYVANRFEVLCHILPKRAVKDGGVPSQAKNPLNIVYLNGDVHKKMDDDLGPKSNGKYVKSMKIFPLLKERVVAMWPFIKGEEKKNIPDFLKPENAD